MAKVALGIRNSELTGDLARQAAQRGEAVCALRHAHGSARVHDVEGVAQLEQVVVGGDGQALGQQAARLLVVQLKAGGGKAWWSDVSHVSL